MLRTRVLELHQVEHGWETVTLPPVDIICSVRSLFQPRLHSWGQAMLSLRNAAEGTNVLETRTDARIESSLKSEDKQLLVYTEDGTPSSQKRQSQLRSLLPPSDPTETHHSIPKNPPGDHVPSTASNQEQDGLALFDLGPEVYAAPPSSPSQPDGMCCGFEYDVGTPQAPVAGHHTWIHGGLQQHRLSSPETDDRHNTVVVHGDPKLAAAVQDYRSPCNDFPQQFSDGDQWNSIEAVEDNLPPGQWSKGGMGAFRRHQLPGSFATAHSPPPLGRITSRSTSGGRQSGPSASALIDELRGILGQPGDAHSASVNQFQSGLSVGNVMKNLDNTQHPSDWMASVEEEEPHTAQFEDCLLKLEAEAVEQRQAKGLASSSDSQPRNSRQLQAHPIHNDEFNIKSEFTETQMLCFTDGLGAPAFVSEAQLQRVRDLLSVDEEDSQEKTKTEDSRQCLPIASKEATESNPETHGKAIAMAGFTTGLGAPVTISGEKLEAARRLLGENDEEEPSPTQPPNKSATIVYPSPDQASTKRDDLLGPPPGDFSSGLPKEDGAATPEALGGFTNGLGASVEVGAKGLQAARNLLNGTDELDRDAHPNSNALIPGFTTGLGTPVTVNASRLEAARKLLGTEEDQKETPILSDPVSNQSRHPASSRFASRDSRHGEHIKTDMDMREVRTPMAGFSTGLGTPVAVGARQLEAARKLLDVSSMEETPERQWPSQTGPKEMLFSSAGNLVPKSRRFLSPANKAVDSLRQPFSAPPSRLGGQPPLSGVKRRQKFQTPRALNPTRRSRSGSPDVVRAAPGFGVTSRTPLHGLGETLLHAAVVKAGDNSDAFMARQQGSMVDAHMAREALLQAGALERYCTPEWVSNAWRLIGWKLDRMESILLGSRTIKTQDIAMDLLKKRYELEFGRGKRSILKAIFQHDHPPSLCMVLAVMSNEEQNERPAAQNTNNMIELTDGWYCIKASLDVGLTELQAAGRLPPGQKLRITGASLQGAGPGEPLQASRSSFLCLTINGTHRAPRESRLGGTKHRSTLLPLSGAVPGGGPVTRTIVVIQRVYPPLVWTQFSDGSSLIQVESAHRIALQKTAATAEKVQLAAVDHAERAELEQCRELLAEGTNDPVTRAYARWRVEGESAGLESLTNVQRARLERHIEERQQVVRAEVESALQGPAAGTKPGLQSPAPAVIATSSVPIQPLLLGTVVHRSTCHNIVPTEALCMIWRPSLEMSDVREGQVYSVLGLEPRVARGEPSARAVMELQSGHSARWSMLASSSTLDSLHVFARPRSSWTIANAPHAGLPPSDIDVEAAYVLRIGPKPLDNSGQPTATQWLFLADRTCCCCGEREIKASRGDAHPPPWILAVRLEGPVRGMDWLDPAEHEGAIVNLKDILLGHVDVSSSVQQAVADRNSTIIVHRWPDESLQEAWVAEGKPLLERLRARATQLLEPSNS